jgi:hypothetical protein
LADPYETLQVLPTADIVVIKAAHRALTRLSSIGMSPAQREAWQNDLYVAGEQIGTEETRRAYDRQQKESAGSTFKPGRVEGEVLGALLVIIDSLMEMHGTVSAPTLRKEMFKDGYSNLDVLLAADTLVDKEFVEQVSMDGGDGPVPGYKLTEDAWKWIKAKRGNFPARPSSRDQKLTSQEFKMVADAVMAADNPPTDPVQHDTGDSHLDRAGGRWGTDGRNLESNGS